MKYSIILPIRNDSYTTGYNDRLGLCIKSILDSFSSLDFELILVDFNSTENSFIYQHPKIRYETYTAVMFRDALDAHLKHGVVFKQGKTKVPHQVVSSSIKFIYSWACNYGISKSSGDFVVFTNSDIVIPRKIVKCMDSHLADDAFFHALPRSATLDYVTRNFRKIMDSRFGSSCNFGKTIQYGRAGLGCFMAIHRSVLQQIGGFLPYIMPRSKGCDLFFSYFCNAYTKCSILLDDAVVDIEHRNPTHVRKWDNYIIPQFDFNQEFLKLTEWFHYNKMPLDLFLKNYRPMRFSLRTNKIHVNNLISAFSKLK